MIAILLAALLQTAPPAQPQPPAQAAPASPAMKAYEEANAAFEKRENDKALAAYDQAISLDQSRPEFHLGRARTLARLQRHEEAIASCSAALKLAPNDTAALIDRGHFYINVRKIDLALADLTRAQALKSDDYPLYYHLGLAYYLKGDYAKAAPAYEACLRTAKTPDNVVACSAWQYATLVRAGRQADAQKVFERITPDMKLEGDFAYLDRLMLFKGVKTEEEVAKTMEKDALTLPTVAYSIGLWHLVNGRNQRAREYFEKATSPKAQASAFGAVAAWAELQRMAK